MRRGTLEVCLLFGQLGNSTFPSTSLFFSLLGTQGFASIAILAAADRRQKHAYKRRDDFESLFNCWLALINLSGPFKSQPGAASRKQQMTTEWQSSVAGVIKESRKKVNENLEDEWKWIDSAKKLLFDHYPDDPEAALEVSTLFLIPL